MTIGSQVYRTLRQQILEMAFRPGEKLSEAQLADRYQVSRAPVRDAIRTLAQEGLVEVKPQVGTIVSPVSPTDAVNLCQIRLLLEPYAAAVAAKRLRPAALRALAAEFRKLGATAAGSARRKHVIFAVDLRLHRTIWAACDNAHIATILNGYLDQMNRIRRATAIFADRLQPSETEMRKIMAALDARDAAKARRAMYIHVLNIRRAIEGVLQSVDGDRPGPKRRSDR